MKEELQAARQSFEQDTNLQQIIIPMKQTSRKFFGLFGPKQEYDTYIQLDKNNSGRIEATHYNPKGFFARLFESNNVKQAILDVFPGSKFSKAHANKDAISNKIIPKIEEEFYDAQTTLQTDPDTVSRAASISATSNHSVKPIQPYDAKSIASNVSERTVVPADVRSIVSDSTIVAPENFMDARDTIPEQTPAPKRLARSVSELSLRAEVPEEKQVPDSQSDTRSQASGWMSVIRNAAAAVTNAVFGTSSQEPSPTAQIPDNSDAESFHSAKSNISDATITSGASYKSTTSIKSTDTQVRATSWAAKKASEAAAVAKTPLRRE